MSVVVKFPIDELQLAQLIADGWTHLTLWVSEFPTGPFTNSGVAADPATLADMSTDEEYTAVFDYAAGSSGQWGKVVPFDGVNYGNLNNSKPFHFGGGTTLTALRRQLGKLIRDMVVGTTTGNGSTTTFVCTEKQVALARDRAYENWVFWVPEDDRWGRVTSWTFNTSTGVFAPATTTIGSGVTFELMKKFTPDEYRDALNQAIMNTFPDLQRPIINTNLRFVPEVYEYLVPGDIKEISSVEIESDSYPTSTSGATRGRPWRSVPYKVIEDDLTMKLEFNREMVSDAAGKRVRIIGSGPLSLLSEEGDYVEAVEPHVELLIYYAAHHLYTQAVADAPASDVDRYEALAKYYLNIYESKRNQLGKNPPPTRIWADPVWRKGIA